MAVYGTISVAVIVAEYRAESAARLMLLVLGYGASIWLAHTYASVTSGAERTWRAALRLSWPVAESALPAVGVLVVATVAGLPTAVAVPAALGACLLNLLVVQVALLRRAGTRTPGRLLATVAVDVAAGALVLAVLTVLR
jgi:hypothetical protein